MGEGWIGFWLGVWVGTLAGVVIAGLLAAAKCGECGQSIQRRLERLSE
jgi:hypothetical protein